MSHTPLIPIAKTNGKNVSGKNHRTIWVLLSMILTSGLFAQAPTRESVNKLTGFQFLLGKWSCHGAFVRSGKEISADLAFEPALEGAWILFRHDDRPPFAYHALSQWGWDGTTARYVSSIQDSSGGLRLFYSQGWQGPRLTWDGGAPGTEAHERFEFERLSDAEFKVSYFILKDSKWSPVDWSSCKK